MTIESKASRFYGRVLIRREGATVGERELDATKDCEALVSALALTISVAIDPIGVSRNSEPASTASVVAPAIETTRPEESKVAQPSSLSEPRAEPAPPSASRSSLRLEVAPMVSIGIAPAVALGLSAFIGAGWPHLSLALEGRLDLPASARLSSGGDVNTSVALATFVPCVHVTRWIGCPLCGRSAEHRDRFGADVSVGSRRIVQQRGGAHPMARTALARGDNAGALDATEAHRRRFPRGRMVEERERNAVCLSSTSRVIPIASQTCCAVGMPVE